MNEIEHWTIAVNEIVGVLKCELDGGFLENTSKYVGEDEKLIYSCLRAIACQIVSIKSLAIVDRTHPIPMITYALDSKFYKPIREYAERMLKEGWVKEIKDD